MQPSPFSRYKDEWKYRRVQAPYLKIISLLGNYLSSLILTHCLSLVRLLLLVASTIINGLQPLICSSIQMRFCARKSIQQLTRDTLESRDTFRTKMLSTTIIFAKTLHRDKLWQSSGPSIIVFRIEISFFSYTKTFLKYSCH